MDKSAPLNIEEMVALAKEEIRTGDIAKALTERCPGITYPMASALSAGVIGRAITFGYTIPSVIEHVVTTWAATPVTEKDIVEND
jgi:hypothetical protein